MTRERTATPGPWEVGYLDHAGQRIVRGEHIEICTCWHHSVGSIEMEMEANAALIAAAPTMLAALKDLRKTARILLQNSTECAIEHHGQETHVLPGWLADCETTIRTAEQAISRAESTALSGQT